MIATIPQNPMCCQYGTEGSLQSSLFALNCLTRTVVELTSTTSFQRITLHVRRIGL